MEMHQHQKKRENDVEKHIEGKQENTQGQAEKQSSLTSPSSPSHEFSFTVSLHSSSTTISEKSTAPPSLAVDLSPADDIFFHGHLLPLHLLSHFSASPRSSTSSMDSFTLPIKKLLEDEKPIKESGSSYTNSKSSKGSNKNNISKNISNREDINRGTKGEDKSKPSFSFFGLTKERRGCQVRQKEDKEEHKRKKLRFDVIHALKRYLGMVQPLMRFRGRTEKIRFHHGNPYSYSSGNLSSRNKKELKGSVGVGQYYSAPASMRTSPTNSGLLLATTALPPASDSTMEELQAAIQAAITHCKNSFAKEDKLKR